MNSLEYLTLNSLTAYPFKYSNDYSAEENAIKKDWFYDILFISKQKNIRQVYISSIKKDISGITIFFSNEEILPPNNPVIASVLISSSEVVDHLDSEKSFASATTTFFDVKLVLGKGLVNKPFFEQDYAASESSLVCSTIVLYTEKLNNLYLKKYNSYFDEDKNKVYEILPVSSYNKNTEIPQISTRANLILSLLGDNSVALDVEAGAGTGLYDPCPSAGSITDVYSLANITPDEEGKLYLRTSFCYSLNTLTEQDVLFYNSFNPSPLEDYATNITNPNHSFIFQNNCSPKCPRENINAFAHYLNRVTDAAIELNSIAYRKTETRGIGFSTLGSSSVFTVSSFSDNEFSRCNTHTTGIEDTYISIGNKFIKNYHEFRVLQLRYSNTDIRNYTILEVLSDNSVRLNTAIENPSTPKSFRVLDNGVFSNMNCAALGYNLLNETYLKPYFKVRYSTNEAYNKKGEYVTYFSVITAVYNPTSQNNISFFVTFDKPDSLVREGDFKIRKENSTYYSNSPSVILNCKEYAFIEAIYYTKTSENNFLNVSVQDIVNNVSLGTTYLTDNAATAPTIIVDGDTEYTVVEPSASSFSSTIELNPTITVVSFYGDIPTWLNTSFSSGTHLITLESTQQPANTSNRRYTFYFKAYGSDVPDLITKLTLDYILSPVIQVPSVTNIAVDRSINYTSSVPLIQLNAANMNSPTSQTANLFYYTITPTTLPTGLIFNPLKGTITGQVDPTVTSGTAFTASFTAVNPAEVSSSITLSFTVN